MAALLDVGLSRTQAPTALSGILIAAIVFLPETITAIRAATLGEFQRLSNLCHGALVSTVGLTIPAVLAIGLITGQTVVLAEKISPIHGAAHLTLFALYLLTI